MTVLTGRFRTPNASKYLQQFCKHFGHKIEVSFDPQKGQCDFEFGTAVLSADHDTLTVRFELSDPTNIDRAKSVTDRHLARFAFREDFSSMDWS